MSRRRAVAYAFLAVSAGGLAVAAVSLAAAPAASSTPTCTITWNGAVSNDWSDAGNWSPARAPMNSDVVCMAATPTRAAVTLSSSTAVRSVVFKPAASSLTVLNSTLSVTEPADTPDASSLRRLTLTSGTWDGSGTVTTALTSTRGSIRTGSVVLTGSATVKGLRLTGGAQVESRGGNLTWNTADAFDVSDGASFTNTPGSTFTVRGNGAKGMTTSGTGASFVNAGTFVVDVTGTTGVHLDVPFANTGAVSGIHGTAFAAGGGVAGVPDTGSYAMATDTVFAFAGGSRTVTTISSSGTGSIGIAGGSTTIGSGTISNLLLTAGAVRGVEGGGFGIGSLTTTGTNTGVVAGPGTVTVTGSGPGAAITSTLGGLGLDDGARVVNQSRTTWNSSLGSFEVGRGSTFTNAPGASFTVTGDSSRTLSNTLDGNAFVNAGSFTLSLDTGAPTLRMAVPFANTGSVTGYRGSASALGGGVAGTPDTGSYSMNPGTVFAFAGGTRSVSTILANSAGSVGVSGGVTTIAAGSVSHLLLTGGTLGSVDGGGFRIGLLTVPGTGSGRIVGPGTVTVTEGGSTLDHLVLDRSARFVNGANSYWDSGRNSFDVRGGSTFTNLATLYVRGNGTYAMQDDGSDNAFLNPGSLTTLLGASSDTVNLQVPITNTGTLALVGGSAVLSNVTNLESGRLDGGSWIVSLGTLTLPGPVTTNAASVRIDNGGQVLATSTGAAAFAPLTENTGSFSSRGTLTLTSTSLTNSGTLSVPGGRLSVPSLTQTAGTIVVAAEAQLDAGAGAIHISGGTVALSEGSDIGTRITTTGPVDIDGADVTIETGWMPPAIGTVRTAVRGGSLTGAVGSVTGADVPEAGGYWALGYTGTSVTLTLTAYPALSVADAEGTTGGDARFTVALDAPSGIDATVHYATVDGTAVAGTDYTATSGILTIPAGSTSGTVVVPLAATSAYAPPKSFTLMLSDPTAAVIARADGTGTIVNTNPDGPTIAGVAPGVGNPGASVAVVITGTGFADGASVTLSGRGGLSLGPVTIVDATTIRASVTIARSAPLGARAVTVTAAGKSATCAGCFSVVAGPTVTSTDRPNLAQATTDVVVTVTGTQFQPGADVKLVKGTNTVFATSTTTNSATSVTALVTLPRQTSPGSWNIAVVNPDGGTGTCVGCVTVWAAPKITSISPATLARGSTTSVTITGSGFVAGALVSIPGAQLSNVVVVNATTITATVRVPATATAGARTVKVFNPASAGNGVAQASDGMTFT